MRAGRWVAGESGGAMVGGGGMTTGGGEGVPNDIIYMSSLEGLGIGVGIVVSGVADFLLEGGDRIVV